MTQEASAHWRRVEDVLSRALDRVPDERAAFVDAACGGDQALRSEVHSLLNAHEQPGAIDRLAPHVTPLAARVTDAVEPVAGDMVGPYRLVEPIGGGGMGLVFRAEDARDRRAVALKLMRPRFTDDTTAVRRFQLEARLVAGLDHPNICQVIDVGETGRGQLYLAMPMYQGQSLGQRLRLGPLPVPEAVEIAAQVARGLAAAHGQGIVHRDIKPSNVLLRTDGTVTILDFGIAKLAGVTLTGSLAGPLGTVAYMSPEQLRGDRVDARSDIWSLGVVLYEMLAGKRPWGRGAVGVVVNAIVHGDPEPVTRHRSGIPDSLDRVLRISLARSAEDRYPTAGALEAELNAILDGRRRAGT